MIILMRLFLQLTIAGGVDALIFKKNIARKGTATQIDTYYDPPHDLRASKALDGITTGDETDYTHTDTQGRAAWWLLTLPRVFQITEIRIYNRYSTWGDVMDRIDGVTVWVGTDLTGGNYDGATKVATIRFEEEKRLYIYSDLHVAGSSVAIRGGSYHNLPYLSLSEVEVYVKSLERPGG